MTGTCLFQNRVQVQNPQTDKINIPDSESHSFTPFHGEKLVYVSWVMLYARCSAHWHTTGSGQMLEVKTLLCFKQSYFVGLTIFFSLWKILPALSSISIYYKLGSQYHMWMANELQIIVYLVISESWHIMRGSWYRNSYWYILKLKHCLVTERHFVMSSTNNCTVLCSCS